MDTVPCGSVLCTVVTMVGTTMTVSAGDAERGVEQGSGVILCCSDEKFCPELEEILAN